MGKGTHVSLFFVVMRGAYDALLKWPFRQKVYDTNDHVPDIVANHTRVVPTVSSLKNILHRLDDVIVS